jgi:integrase
MSRSKSNLYNEEVKKKFLEYIETDTTKGKGKGTIDKKTKLDYKKQTAEAYGRIFISSAKFEKEYEMDLFDFNQEQIDELMYDRKPKTKVASRTVGRIITKYIDWAISNNYRENKKNPLDVPQSYFNKFVPEEKTQYLNVDEVKYLLDQVLVNEQDAVIVALLFNGVEGKQASEIRNLTIDDVDTQSKKLLVKDDKHLINEEENIYDEDKAYRVVNLKHDELETLSIIKGAHKEFEYAKKNGNMDSSPQIKEEVILPYEDETPYIIKTAKRKEGHFEGRATQYTIYNRLEMIRGLKEVESISDKLTTKNIVRSGMIFEAKRLLETEGGELDNSKLKRVCDKYNVKNHWSVRDFISMDVIQSLYGEIEIPAPAEVEMEN